LSQAEQSILRKGLNFAVTPEKLPVNEIIATTEVACLSLKRPGIADALRSEVVRILQSSEAPKSNISKEERQALKTLQKCKDILILPADKGRATVVMNKEEYNRKIRALLGDTNTYKELSADPTQRYKNNLARTLREWKKQKVITDQAYDRVYPHSESIPKFYGLPKIHKKDAPLRPITSSIGSVTYQAAKFLAKVLGPLVGKNHPHHVKNSVDFVSKIKELEIPPTYELVSYDVTALFTSIPIEDAVEVVRRRLRTDPDIVQDCGLGIEQITALLEKCLKLSYFMFEGVFYQQLQGAAMGSPVSPIVANLYMESFELEALASAPCRPQIWYRYVDDTFTMMPSDEISGLTEHLNSRDPNIKFTYELQENNQLAFLDVLITVKDDGSTKTSIFRKATHTDQYLNFRSNHHLQHKRSVIRTLMYRADNVVTEEADVKSEKDHIKKVLSCNDYTGWAFNIPKRKCRSTHNPDGDTPSRSAPVGLTYIQGLSERLDRTYRKYGVKIYHKPENTLRSLLVKPKDKDTPCQKSNAIYHITCGGCTADYIGETGRSVGVRFGEHLDTKKSNSAVSEHINKYRHAFPVDNVKILTSEDHSLKRRVKESIAIRTNRPSLNRDQGYDLPPVYQPLLSRVKGFQPTSRGNSQQQQQSLL
jgi:hypothetical protein